MVQNLSAPWLESKYRDPDYVTPIHGGKFLPGLERQKNSYIRRLNADASPEAHEIAAELMSCSAITPCNDGICPPCGLAQNQWFRDEAHGLFDDKHLITFSTVQLSNPKSLPLRLTDLDIGEQHQLLGQALTDAGLTQVPFLGASDFSHNTYSDGAQTWSCHWTLLTCDRDPATISKLLNGVIGETEHVPVPAKTLVIRRTPDRVFSYTLKFDFFRRVANSRFKPPKITPSDPLFIELAIALHKFGRANRLIARNVDVSTG